MSKQQKAKEQEERPITVRWTSLSGSQHSFQSSDDAAIDRKCYSLYLQYITSKIREFYIEY